jgi:hypothetical protein
LIFEIVVNIILILRINALYEGDKKSIYQIFAEAPLLIELLPVLAFVIILALGWPHLSIIRRKHLMYITFPAEAAVGRCLGS